MLSICVKTFKRGASCDNKLWLKIQTKQLGVRNLMQADHFKCIYPYALCMDGIGNWYA